MTDLQLVMILQWLTQVCTIDYATAHELFISLKPCQWYKKNLQTYKCKLKFGRVIQINRAYIFLKTEMEEFFYKSINTCGSYKIGKFISVYIWQDVFVK